MAAGGDELRLPPFYGGPVQAYALMLQAGKAVICTGGNVADAGWHLNRCRILSANGPLTLTIPLYKDTRALSDVAMSSHGNWQRLHRGAFFSAYGRSPYFEHIADKLYALIDAPLGKVVDFDVAMMRLMIEFMQLPITIEESSDECTQPSLSDVAAVPYWQVWRQRFGFVEAMSIFDLAFCEGPMAINTLRLMTR